jgi:uncharacterized protein YndB with AHSA1/START domain
MKMETTVTRQVAAGPELLWSILTDFRSYPDRISSYVSLEFLTETESGVGARWRQVRTVFGSSHAQVMQIDIWVPPRELVTRANESGARYTVARILEPLDAGTSLEVRFVVEATNPVARLFQRIMGRRLLASTQAAMERDLDDLIAVALRGTDTP